MCFITFLTEGAALDWSGVYLTTNYQVPLSIAGLAYGFFAITMTIGRFSGHHMMRWFGEKNLILFSSICATLGMTIVVIAPVWHLVLLGYALVGLGSSNVVPVLFQEWGVRTICLKRKHCLMFQVLLIQVCFAGQHSLGLLDSMWVLLLSFRALRFAY